MLHRRRFLSAVALTPVAIAIAPMAIARAEDDARRAPLQTPRAAGPGTPAAGAGSAAVEQLAPVGAIGRQLELAGGFRVVRAFDLHYGALPFVLEGEGERFQIDVLRREPNGPSGVFDTEHFSLFVRNQGSPLTAAAHERGARALGAALERRVAEGVCLPGLASFAERRARHPAAIYDVDYDTVHTVHSGDTVRSETGAAHGA